MTEENKIKVIEEICSVQKAYYMAVDGGPSTVFSPSTLEVLKILFPNGL